MEYAYYTMIGYLSGSVMFAYYLPKVLYKKDIRSLSKDGNPGVANTFAHAGIPVGILALVLELMKGFFPVYVASNHVEQTSLYFAFVMMAPVVGHAYSVFLKGHGGKAIAVSFGVLLGLYPVVEPVIVLVVLYIVFSLIIRINPHMYRSVITFLLSTMLIYWMVPIKSIVYGCFAISFIVIWKHLKTYQGESFQMKLFFTK